MNKAAILRQQMLEKKLGTRAPKLPAAGELKIKFLLRFYLNYK